MSTHLDFDHLLGIRGTGDLCQWKPQARALIKARSRGQEVGRNQTVWRVIQSGTVVTPVILVVVLLHVWIGIRDKRIVNVDIGVLLVRIIGIFGTAVIMLLHASQIELISTFHLPKLGCISKAPGA